MRCLLVVACLLVAGLAQAKPLYITVPRTFSSSESPTIDLAFAEQEPVHLRILRPLAPDAFIRRQANLRRAYQEPAVLLNPGRYLARGLNAMRTPGTFLLQALGEGYRQEVAHALPPRDAATAGGGRLLRLHEGSPKVVEIPDDMVPVRDLWLNLDLGGSEQAFNVPGFEAWRGRSGYQERRITLTPLPPGIYMVQLVQGMVEGQAALLVSDLNVQVKQTDGEVLVRVASRAQAPVAAANVQVLLDGGKSVTATTDAEGEARLAVQAPRVLVQVAHGSDVAVVDTDFYSTQAVTPEVFIYSDRPLYRPGDAVQFRGVVRKPEGFLAALFVPRPRQVTVALESALAPVSVQATVDDYGSFAGSLAVPAEAEGGVLHLRATLEGHVHQSEARVQAYVKPTFYLELQSDQDSITPGTEVHAQVRARRYAGGVPANTAYEVTLYRTLLETPSWVDDAGLGALGSDVTYTGPATQEASLSIPVRLYASVEARQNQPEFVFDDPWQSAPTLNAEGEATLVVPVPPLTPAEARLPFKYTLTVRAKDAEQSTATAAKTFFHASCEVMGQLTSRTQLAFKGAEQPFSVRSVSLGGRPVAAVSGEVGFVWTGPQPGDEKVLRHEALRTDAEGVWRAAWPTDRLGLVTARVTLRDAAQHTWQGETTLTVAGADGAQVVAVPELRAAAAAETLAPGGQGQVVAMFPEGWGTAGKNSGSVWVTLVGSAVFSTQRLQVSGHTLVHAFAVEPRFGSAVYAQVAYPDAQGRWEERTVPYRILPTERLLAVRVQPERAEVAPLGAQTVRIHVSDARGAPAVAQVSVGVVDKAVYALQSEFRPHIVDFFYPLGRNNVATFLSAEFAAYGYGERLARLLRGAPRHDFAAIKPPSRKRDERERDTALWQGRLLTNEAGDVTVSFDMPSNPTLWTVTAVAADARGRFGEGTAEFASRGSLTVMAQLPAVLRVGDTATGSIRVARMAQGTDTPLALTLQADASGTVSGAPVATALRLPKNAETATPIALSASRPGLGRVDVGLSGAQQNLASHRSLDVLPATVEETQVLSRQGAGELQLALPAGAAVQELELSVMPSTVAAALDGMQDLLTLPFGSLINLVMTTVPNLAVVRVLERTGVRGRLDPQSQALLAEAHSRAVQGVQRILQLTVPTGGFTWFYGYSTPSPELTLLALEGLALAVESDLVDAHDPRLAAATHYLESSTLPVPLTATRTYVLARLYGKAQAPQARALVERAALEGTYATTLAVLAAQYAGVAREPAVAARLGALVEQSRRAMADVSQVPLDRDTFWAFPLRRQALAAMVSEAAAVGALDAASLQQVRAQFIQAMASPDTSSAVERGMVLLHSAWLLERDAKAQASAAPQVSSDVGSVTLRPGRMGFVAQLDPKSTRVRLTSFDGVARLRARLRTPFTALQAKEEGMVLERRHYLITEQAKVPLQDGAAVPPGALVYTELRLNARAHPRSWMRSAYYTLEDAVPAGFEPVEEDKIYAAAPYSLSLTHAAVQRRVVQPERVQFFFNEPAWWQDSPRTVGYVMRAQYVGTYGVPPATLRDLLAPSLFAQTGALHLSIARPTP